MHSGTQPFNITCYDSSHGGVAYATTPFTGARPDRRRRSRKPFTMALTEVEEH